MLVARSISGMTPADAAGRCRHHDDVGVAREIDAGQQRHLVAEAGRKDDDRDPGIARGDISKDVERAIGRPIDDERIFVVAVCEPRMTASRRPWNRSMISSSLKTGAIATRDLRVIGHPYQCPGARTSAQTSGTSYPDLPTAAGATSRTASPGTPARSACDVQHLPDRECRAARHVVHAAGVAARRDGRTDETASSP